MGAILRVLAHRRRLHGGRAEYVCVPYANVGPTVIPADMDPDDAVLLTDVVPTGYQAVDTVVAFGTGPVGIMAAKCAWLFGMGCVVVVDRLEYRLEYRLEFVRNYAQCGAYNFRSLEDPVLFIKKTTD